MVGADMLWKINRFLRDAYSSVIDFAGRSVLLTGDIQQLLPVKAQPLWAIIRPTDSSNVLQGKLLFQKFNLNFNLTHVVRQSGIEQERFRELLKHVASGDVRQDDFDMLKTRFVNSPPNPAQTFFLVPTKKKRDFYNDLILQKLSLSTPVFTADAKYSEGYTGLRHFQDEMGISSRILLCKDMLVMLTQNIRVDMGLVNGATGT